MKKPRKKYGLERGHYKAHVRWAVDSLDIQEELSEADKEFYRRFLKEYYDDEFDRDATKHLHTSRLLPEKEWRYNPRTNEYVPTTQRQDCVKRNNDRNRKDDYSYHELSKQHVSLDKPLGLSTNSGLDPEQELLNKLSTKTKVSNEEAIARFLRAKRSA